MENNIRDLIKEVLEKGYLMSLGTQDEGGVWVADVIYIFDDEFNLYWMSEENVRHSKAISEKSLPAGRQAKVAGTITAADRGEELGIQFEGVAEKIEGVRYDLAKKHFTKRGKVEPRETDDVLEGDSWYVLKPTKIELIHKKLFGFEKKKLVF